MELPLWNGAPVTSRTSTDPRASVVRKRWLRFAARSHSKTPHVLECGRVMQWSCRFGTTRRSRVEPQPIPKRRSRESGGFASLRDRTPKKLPLSNNAPVTGRAPTDPHASVARKRWLRFARNRTPKELPLWNGAPVASRTSTDPHASFGGITSRDPVAQTLVVAPAKRQSPTSSGRRDRPGSFP